jgi:hypothetical protein
MPLKAFNAKGWMKFDGSRLMRFGRFHTNKLVHFVFFGANLVRLEKSVFCYQANNHYY